MGVRSGTQAEELELPERRHELLGIGFGAVTALVALALGSYTWTGDAAQVVGPAGRWAAQMLTLAFGWGAWLICLELGLATVRMFRKLPSLLGLTTALSSVVVLLISSALLHLAFAEPAPLLERPVPGGLVGEAMGEVLKSVVGIAGAYIVCVAFLLMTVMLRTPLSLVELARAARRFVLQAGAKATASCRELWHAWRQAKELEEAPPSERAQHASPGREASDSVSDELSAEDADEDPDTLQEAVRRHGAATGPRIVAPPTSSSGAAARPPSFPGSSGTPASETTSSALTAPRSKGPFELPPTTLLESPPHEVIHVDERTLHANADRLVEKLEAYGVRGRVDEIHPGPVVTMYEFEPQSGTKVSKIAGLGDDLAMALAAQKVRIVAPIPGKARVGFELPNDHRQTVYLREILEDARWQRTKGALPVALGKDIAGQPVYGDLARMPHLLVAGATGAGKSVGLNVLLASLLHRKTPEEVRMLMIDPKVVELAVFDGIPHMLLPVVTDMKQAARALRWAVDEMERRYQLFADAGARNITTYNERVEKVLRGELAPEKLSPRRAGKVRAQGAEGEEVLLDPESGEQPDAVQEQPEKLPYVVVVVDEFADLMMVAAKDVEAAIARLAQKARAAGIHVILATQRPSVDVITGMIKANFPARIGFKVSQREDSKTILGRTGAEHLLGMGDMLMIPPGSSDLRRVHCAYINEDEVRSICDHLREQGAPQYDKEILKPREDEEGSSGSTSQSSDDPLYDRAVAVVAQAGYCSISHIQRQLTVGYNKAAKLVERMEQEGVVGPPSSKAGGRREVLVQAL